MAGKLSITSHRALSKASRPAEEPASKPSVTPSSTDSRPTPRPCQRDAGAALSTPRGCRGPGRRCPAGICCTCGHQAGQAGVRQLQRFEVKRVVVPGLQTPRKTRSFSDIATRPPRPPRAMQAASRRLPVDPAAGLSWAWAGKFVAAAGGCCMGGLLGDADVAKWHEVVRQLHQVTTFAGAPGQRLLVQR